MGEAGWVELRRHALALAEAQQLADQAAARMADQMQLRALGQAAHKRERIGHRAFGEAAVLEGEGAPGVGGGQAGAGVAAGGVVGSPQLAEAALRAGGGAVQQDQQRLRGGRQQRLVRERGEGEGAVQAQGVQAGFAAFELAVLEPASELGGGLFLDADAEELEHADAQPERAALAAAGVGRGGREAVVPRVAQQRIELPRVAAIARQAAPAVFAHQRVGARPQLEAVIQLDAHHLVGGDFQLAGHAVACASGGEQAMAEHRGRGLGAGGAARCGLRGGEIAADAEAACGHGEAPEACRVAAARLVQGVHVVRCGRAVSLPAPWS